MIARRNFLGGLAGILAAGTAPAIIHNAMKISVAQDRNAQLIKRAMDELYAIGDRMKVYVDQHAASGQFISGGRRYQTIDTSRGFHLYEIPMLPVGAGKHVPILVPPERRVLRFA